MTPALIISISALLFTIASFWWINLRPGHVRMTAFHTFSGFIRPDRARLRIPVTLFNTGAKPLVIVDLRLRLGSAGISCTAPTSSFRKSIKPSQDDQDDFPHPYVVNERSVVTKFVGFDPEPQVMASGEPASATLEVLIHGRGWRQAGKTQIRTDIMADPSVYITYSNNPAHWPSDQRERAREALATVRSSIKPN